jgi:hypothetical protein
VKGVCIHANQVEWQRQYLPWFKSGFEAHGVDVFVTDKDAADAECINVVFANNSWKRTVNTCNMTGIPLITVNRCFFGDRHDMVAIGWNGFNGDADFCLESFMPDDRWMKHGFEIPAWNYQKTGYVLICGEFRDMSSWYRELGAELEYEEVRFRPHPFVSTVPAAWPKAPGKRQDDIATALFGARVCITFDSIAGCDAALAGVPSITYGRKSMAWDVSYHSWTQYKTAALLPKQLPWACKLAYCKWSHDEIRSGEFWRHLRTGLSYPWRST